MCHSWRAPLSLSLSPPETSVCRIKGFLPRNASNCHEGMEEIQASFSGVAWPGFVLHTSSHIYATMKTVGFFFLSLSPSLSHSLFGNQRWWGGISQLQFYITPVVRYCRDCIMSFRPPQNNRSKHFGFLPLSLSPSEAMLCIAANCSI